MGKGMIAVACIALAGSESLSPSWRFGDLHVQLSGLRHSDRLVAIQKLNHPTLATEVKVLVQRRG